MSDQTIQQDRTIFSPAQEMEWAIHVRGLSRTFQKIEAVKDLTFAIGNGEIFGLLGPNGAGKSTTINMLCGYMEPTAGDAVIHGASIQKETRRVKHLIGVVPQEIALYHDMSAQENLHFFGAIYGLSAQERRQRAEELLQFMGLYDRRKERLEHFSGGMKRRINIAAALMHRPSFLMLDEPTVGVDPQSRENIFEAIEQVRDQGTTILYTTHYMEEAERLCDRIAIMDEGQIIALGTLEQLLTLREEGQMIQRPHGLQELFIQLTGKTLRD